MRYCISILFVSICVFPSGRLGAHPIYNLVRIYTDNVDEVASLGVDIVGVKRGIAVDAVVPSRKMYELEGKRCEILIQDMERYYSDRMSSKQNFGDFYTYDEAYAIVDSLSAGYPELVKERWEIGEGWEGGKIYALKISDNPDIDENDEPEVLFDACIHAREPVTVNVLVKTMKYILENYGLDPEITFLIENRQLYFIPIVNPDGYLYNESTHPGGGGMWRKNRRANGDSAVDLNRNFPYMWGYDDYGSSPYIGDPTYRGPYAASEPETQAYMAFVDEHNFVANLSYHSYAGLLLHPWGYNNTLPPDYSMYYEPFSIYLSRDNNYPYGTPGDLLYNVNGCTFDWMYGDEECYSFSPEVDGESFWDEASIPRNLAECIPMNVKLALASGPYLTYKEHIIDDDEYGNGNGEIDASETVGMPVTVKNIGIFDDVHRVTGLLSTRDAYIELVSASSNFGDVSAQEEIASSDAYGISCSPDCPSGYGVTFSLELIGSNYWSKSEFGDIVGEPTYVFYDDFEYGSSQWLWDSPWAITSSESYSPDNSATDSPYGNYGNAWDKSMTMCEGIDLSPPTYALLAFYHKYSFENGYDYGYCEVSTDNGETWTTLRRYTGLQSEWTEERISLDDYCGESNLRLRFRIDTDTYITADGWYIDDVAIAAFPVDDHPPSSPVPLHPADGDTVYSAVLVLENAVDADGDQLSYGFKVYTDSLLTNPVVDTAAINEGVDTTVCELQLPVGRYYWRAYAEDSLVRGLCCLPTSFTLMGTEVTEDVRRSPLHIYPNPTRGPVEIDCGVSDGDNKASPTIRVYDLAGRLVRVFSGNDKVLFWNGMDDNGREVSSGVYYFEVNGGMRKKIIYVR